MEGGEKISSAAGVFGGSESRGISVVGTGSMGGSVGISIVSIAKFRLSVIRLRAGFCSGFLSFARVEERCFFGESTGSVFTGSARRKCENF